MAGGAGIGSPVEGLRRGKGVREVSGEKDWEREGADCTSILFIS